MFREEEQFLQKFVLRSWFGIDARKCKGEEDIQRLDFLQDKQKRFVIEVLNCCVDNVDILVVRKNREGQYDIRKQEVCEKLGIPYNNFRQKCRKIKDNCIKYKRRY